MGKVYGSVEGIEKPEYERGATFEKHVIAENEYIDKILNYALANGKGEYKGQEVRFSVADGYARYVVLSTRPLQLIHLGVGDSYHFPYVERLTAKDIVKEIERAHALREIFSKKA